MSILLTDHSDWTGAQQSRVHQKRLLHVRMVRGMFTNICMQFDQHIPCGSRVMGIFTNTGNGQTDQPIHCL